MRRQKLSLISGITVTPLTSHKDHDKTNWGFNHLIELANLLFTWYRPLQATGVLIAAFFRFSLSPDQAAFGLQSFSLENTILGEKCPRGGPCNPAHRFRSYDGSCNNLQQPLWGTARTPFQRSLLPGEPDQKGFGGDSGLYSFWNYWDLLLK